jgi:hypothetical protein
MHNESVPQGDQQINDDEGKMKVSRAYNDIEAGEIAGIINERKKVGDEKVIEMDVIENQARYENLKRKNNGVIKVRRSTGEMEDGWEIGAYQDTTGRVWVGKEDPNAKDESLTKLVKLDDLISWNE